MDYEEALAWMRGERSMCNSIPQDPFSDWEVRIAQADAAMKKQAYYVLKAHKEGLLPGSPDSCPTDDEPHMAS